MYHVAGFPFALADTVREDSEGRIWSRTRGRDILFLDFTLPEGEQYRFPNDAPLDDSLEVTIERDVVAEVGAGRFVDCVRFLFDTPALDDERIYAFAQGVGVVYAYGILGDYAELNAAVVDGRPVSIIRTRDPRPEWQPLHVYPNPASASATLTFSIDEPSMLDASVVDLLGRTVKVLPRRHYRSGTHAVRIDTSLWPAGVYVVRLRGETISIGRILTVVH